MLSEYLQLTYPKYMQIRGVPLGVIDSKLMADVGFKKAVAYSRPYRPEADSLVILPGALVLIEAKVWNVINGLAKLPLYKSLVPVTPELKEYHKLPVVMELVVGWTNSNLEIMAGELNVKIKVYSPPWLNEVVQRMQNYWTADYRAARDQKLQQRQVLGLE